LLKRPIVSGCIEYMKSKSAVHNAVAQAARRRNGARQLSHSRTKALLLFPCIEHKRADTRTHTRTHTFTYACIYTLFFPEQHPLNGGQFENGITHSIPNVPTSATHETRRRRRLRKQQQQCSCQNHQRCIAAWLCFYMFSHAHTYTAGVRTQTHTNKDTHTQTHHTARHCLCITRVC
jgi:hypothetical protein